MKIFISIIIMILLTGAMVFGISEARLIWRNRYEVKHQDISREVFEHSKSRVHGAIQDLSNFYSEYQTADAETRKGIRTIVRMRFSNFDEQLISSLELRVFLIEMRGF